MQSSPHSSFEIPAQVALFGIRNYGFCLKKDPFNFLQRLRPQRIDEVRNFKLLTLLIFKYCNSPRKMAERLCNVQNRQLPNVAASNYSVARHVILVGDKPPYH